ncbi:MAG: MFS transporter [Candidatus Kariarchaeaceae archaeon]|jgi:MFS family permease
MSDTYSFDPQIDNIIESENEHSSEHSVNIKDRFIIFGSLMQIFMAAADSLAGTFAMIYAVTRGSVGFMQGVIVSVRELGQAILQPIWGVFSDRRGRRYFVFAGFIFQSISWGLLLPVATTPTKILLVFIFQTSLGTMLVPTWNAWVGDRTSTKNRGGTLGLLGFVGSWAASIAVLSMSLWMQKVDPDREFVSTYILAFRMAGIFYLIAAFVTLIIPETKRTNSNEKTAREKTFVNPLVKIKNRIAEVFYSYKPEFRRILVIDGIFRFSWSMAWPLFPYATLAATRGWIEIAILSVLTTVMLGISQLIGGRLSDRVGRKKVIVVTRLSLVLPPLFYSIGVWLNQPIYLFISNMIVGINLGAGVIAMTSLILDVAPEDKQATYFSTYITAMGVIAFVGSLFMGLLLSIVTPNSAPTKGILISLFVVASVCRFLAWLGYRYLPELEIAVM